ncbi:hypothetical protein FGB62_22g040 [Gracilaria domingensis]|nr:hypothetical protein FGB62_22g040 [Gracilaria domingensis]
MRNPRSTGHDKDNHISLNSRKWNRRRRNSSQRPLPKESFQEKWDRINPFQKSPQELCGEQLRHDNVVPSQRDGMKISPSGLPRQPRYESVLKTSVELNTRLTSEECETTEQPSSFRRLLFAQEHSDSDRKHHIQLVIKELKSKVRKTTRVDDRGEVKGFESPDLLPFSRDLEPFESPPAECNDHIPRSLGIKDSQGSPLAEVSADVQGESVGHWIEKVTKISRNKGLDVNTSRKGRSPNQGRARGGLLGIGKGAQNNTKIAAFFQGMAKERQNSPDSGAGRPTRIQPGIKGLQGVLRKVRSYDSNAASKSSPRCRNSCRCCSEIVPAHNDLVRLEKSLWKSEVTLAGLVERQAKDRLEFSRQIAGLKNTCTNLKRTQEMHYRNVLDEFNENYRVIGNVESHFGYVTSVIGKGRRSDVVTEVLRLMGDNTIAVLLNIVRATTSLYLYFFPRNRNKHD